MFRFLGRLIVALVILFIARLFFVAARRAVARRSRGTSDRTAASGGRSDPRPAPPRIDRSSAEDVPFVEVESERSARS